MTDWETIGCARGCESHPTRTVHIQLGGPTPYFDLTPIPDRFAIEFDLEIWDTDLTPPDDDERWCPARDVVSETLLSLGVWEPQETTVMLLALEACDVGATFVDLGAQIGWFSIIAEHRKADIIAMEADRDVADVLRRNLASRIVFRQRITYDTLPWSVSSDDRQYVVKIDIEGAEAEAIEMITPMIDAGQVPFILMEVSPCFNDTYPDLVTGLMDRDYAVYRMPPKQVPPVVIDQLADLRPFRLNGDFGEVWDEVASWSQENIVLIQGGVGAWT